MLIIKCLLIYIQDRLSKIDAYWEFLKAALRNIDAVSHKSAGQRANELINDSLNNDTLITSQICR
jgi:hypothetical protein